MDFSKDFLNEMQKNLENMKKEVLDKIESINLELGEQSEAKEEGDIVQEVVDRTLKANFAEREKSKLMKINQALGKMQNGTYGYCIDTEEPISEQRLRANPLALRTVEAQEDFESNR